jgi:hypothetical protein
MESFQILIKHQTLFFSHFIQELEIQQYMWNNYRYDGIRGRTMVDGRE